METVFTLDHGELEANPQFQPVARALEALGPIDSADSFNRYCREACRVWKQHFPEEIGTTSVQFLELQARIRIGAEGIIQTSWGGVVITLHEHPRVEKYLLVRCGGYLALETHEEKDERLEVEEGAGLILFRQASGEPLKVQVLVPGDQFHFEPGMEHCIIGTEDLLVFERSVDSKGMDKDLVFIYEPSGAPSN